MLDPEQRALRLRVGCDEPLADDDCWYVILCPRCNGTRVGSDGQACSEDDCIPNGEHRGHKWMRRCPGSYQTPNVSRAIRCWQNLRAYKTWPVAGGSMDQAAGFLDFLVEIEAAMADAMPKKKE